MGDFWSAGSGSASLVLGLAIVAASCAPTWAVLLWTATSSVPWHWKAEKSWKSFLIVIAFIVAVIASFVWMFWANDLFAPWQKTERNALFWVWIVQEFIAAIATVTAMSVRAPSDAVNVSRVHWERRHGLAVILALGVLAVAIVALAALGVGSAPPGDWWALLAASGLLVALIVLLIVTVVELCKGATGKGPDETRTGGKGDAAAL